MSRPPSHQAVVVKPSTNVYTILLIVATIVVVIGLAILFIQSARLFPPGGLL